MYIIIKGRVTVEILRKDLEDHPVIVAILSDGDHFGELGVIN